MNYQEARAYLKNVNKYGSVLGLDSIMRLLDKLGSPQDDLRAVQIAGTNGKGSVMSFLQSILLEAGYNVGRYSSPAVFNEREIIRYNNQFIKKAELAEIISLIKAKCDEMVEEGLSHPTPFEIETAAALVYFRKKQCDIVLIECGMGGATDATNVFQKVLCSIITTISLDHMQFLGDTIEKIAKIKAGIIKEGCPIVMSAQTEEALNVVRKEQENKNSKIILTNTPYNITTVDLETCFDYQASDEKTYHIRLKALGTYQIINSITAIEAAIILQNQGFSLKKCIGSGIHKTIWHGRMEVISRNPLVIIDGAHNPGAVEELKRSIDLYFTNKRITFIMGVLSDKDFVCEAKMIAERAEKIITVTPDNPRALAAEILADSIKKYHNNVCVADSILKAVSTAYRTIEDNQSDMILAFGSLSYLGELKETIINANS